MSGHNVCSSSSVGCRATCLNYAGHGRYPRTQLARIRRTKYFFEDRPTFMADVYSDIERLIRKCKKEGLLPCVRLNGTSDIVWERVWPDIFQAFPNVQFYDYTKHIKRCNPTWYLPSNYHLTFSRSEDNQAECIEALNNGYNCAVVFKKCPTQYFGYRVRNGDDSDLRFMDRFGVIGLTPKGRAKHDKTNFVVLSGDGL